MGGVPVVTPLVTHLVTGGFAALAGLVHSLLIALLGDEPPATQLLTLRRGGIPGRLHEVRPDGLKLLPRLAHLGLELGLIRIDVRPPLVPGRVLRVAHRPAGGLPGLAVVVVGCLTRIAKLPTGEKTEDGP